MKKTDVRMTKPMYLGLSILDISKPLMYEFWYDIFNQRMKIKQNYVTLILTVVLFILKLKIFTKTLLVMLNDGLIHLTMTKIIKDHFQ